MGKICDMRKDVATGTPLREQRIRAEKIHCRRKLATLNKRTAPNEQTLLDLDDTIVAPATGSPPAAIAIVRLSGKKTLRDSVRKIFRVPARIARSLNCHPIGWYLGWSTVGPENRSTKSLESLVREPPEVLRAKTLQNSILMGAAAVVRAVVEACVEAGARLAEPGEFTRRAFLNGRMDLVQAEALADLIHAQTQQARRLALRQLQGGLSSKVMKLREWLLDVAAELEAWIDFPEEEIPIPTIARHLEIFADVTRELQRLTQGLRAGLLLSEGARVVIAGRPNAGKSSLFNMLVGRERAIVTPHPGTTRDTIESTVELGGIAVTLVDTAGLRHTADEIEGIGIERARQEIRLADLVLLVVDASHPREYPRRSRAGRARLRNQDRRGAKQKLIWLSEEQIGELTAQLHGLNLSVRPSFLQYAGGAGGLSSHNPAPTDGFNFAGRGLPDARTSRRMSARCRGCAPARYPCPQAITLARVCHGGRKRSACSAWGIAGRGNVRRDSRSHFLAFLSWEINKGRESLHTRVLGLFVTVRSLADGRRNIMA